MDGGNDTLNQESAVVAGLFWRVWFGPGSASRFTEIFILPVIVFVGVVGNALIFVLMNSRRNNSNESVKIVMRCLSFADLVILLHEVLNWMNTISFSLNGTRLIRGSSWWLWMLSDLGSFGHFVSTWMIVLLSGLRLAAVRFSFRSRRYIRPTSTWWAVLVVNVFGASVMWLGLSHFTIQCSGARCSRNQLYGWISMGRVAVAFVVPTILVSAFNLSMIKTLTRTEALQLDNPAAYVKRKNQTASKRLIKMTTVFVLSRLPFILLSSVRNRYPSFKETFDRWVGFTWIIYISNYSLNMIYFIFHSKRNRRLTARIVNPCDRGSI